jgi:hypothetical protein
MHAEPVVTAPGQAKPPKMAKLFQVAALALGFAAAALGAICVGLALFPGPCGDSGGPGLLVIVSLLVDVPVALLVLAVGIFVRRGSARLRRMCVAISLAALCLPGVCYLLMERWLAHCAAG